MNENSEKLLRNYFPPIVSYKPCPNFEIDFKFFRSINFKCKSFHSKTCITEASRNRFRSSFKVHQGGHLTEVGIVLSKSTLRKSPECMNSLWYYHFLSQAFQDCKHMLLKWFGWQDGWFCKTIVRSFGTSVGTSINITIQHSICCFFPSFKKHFDSRKIDRYTLYKSLANYMKTSFPCHKIGPSPPYTVNILFWIPWWSLKIAQILTWRGGAAWAKWETSNLLSLQFQNWFNQGEHKRNIFYENLSFHNFS